MLEETRLDHAISSAVTATKFTTLCHPKEEENEQQKGKIRGFFYTSTFKFLTIWLSYCIQSFLITDIHFCGLMLPKSWYISIFV